MKALTITAHRGALEIRPASEAQFLLPILTYYEKSVPTKTMSFYDKKEGKVGFEFEPRAAKVPAKKAAAKKAAA